MHMEEMLAVDTDTLENVLRNGIFKYISLQLTPLKAFLISFSVAEDASSSSLIS